MNNDDPVQTEMIQYVQEQEYQAEIDRYEIIYTPTGRFFIIDFKKIETKQPKNE